MPDRDKELKLAKIQTTIADHYKRGDYHKALDAAKILLEETDQHFGREHPATASALNNIGLMHKMLGDFVESRKHYNLAMRVYGKVVGRDHASYAMALHNLGSLNKSQVHFDTSLKALERLSLVETALEYFEEAWAIRKAELGDEHPHTVATQTSYGSTLAAQVLFQHRAVEQGKGKQRQYVPLNPERVTNQGWDAAEEHLRGALKTATHNPRGKNILKPSKKNKANLEGNVKSELEGIQTLSAAAAAQNLAVFLKAHATTKDPPEQAWLDEAKRLYSRVEYVRTKLLPKNHPDLYATKFSLAELLEVMGDEEAANALRQEIVDTYDPPDGSGEDSKTSVDDDILQEFPSSSKRKGEEATREPKRVVVETTKFSGSK